MNQPSAPAPTSKPKKRPPVYGLWRTMQTIFSVGLLTATLLTFWTPVNLFSNNLMDQMLVSAQKVGLTPLATVMTATPSPKPRIGIVAGHWGNDSGAVCSDGLTEAELNLRTATMVMEILKKEGYIVDLLKEFDPRLSQYEAKALVSIHNDSCDYINDQATGFKVSAVAASLFPEKAVRLTACLSERYQRATGLSFHYGSVTRDMSDYHAFREINSSTTAAIIETGFMNLDREILTQHADKVATGVADGILCYMRNENVPPTPTPAQNP